MKPAEKPKPAWMLKSWAVARAKPVKRACSIKSGGATKRKRNSKGSVMPVKKEVKATNKKIAKIVKNKPKIV